MAFLQGKYIVNATLFRKGDRDCTHLSYATDRVPGVGDMVELSIRQIGGVVERARGRVTQAGGFSITACPSGLNCPTVDEAYAITVEFV
jgi:hypothetical protein